LNLSITFRVSCISVIVANGGGKTEKLDKNL